MKRMMIYLAGAILLATGLTLNTKAGLGVSPIISVAFSISEIFNLNFGNVTLAYYALFILIEIILHAGNRKQQVMDLLQLPFSIVFTRFLNLFGAWIPDYSESSVLIRSIVLLGAIVLTGIGAAMMLDTHLVPNPGDGVVKAIADKVHKTVGLTKNIVDCFCILLTITLSLLLTGRIIGIGVGTIIAMIGVGRVISAYQSICKKVGNHQKEMECTLD